MGVMLVFGGHLILDVALDGDDIAARCQPGGVGRT